MSSQGEDLKRFEDRGKDPLQVCNLALSSHKEDLRRLDERANLTLPCHKSLPCHKEELDFCQETFDACFSRTLALVETSQRRMEEIQENRRLMMNIRNSQTNDLVPKRKKIRRVWA